MINDKAARGGRGRPTGWRRRILRLPVLLYRAGLGPALGKRFLLLHHTGRVSGRAHMTVLEVVSFDPAQTAWTVATGFGPRGPGANTSGTREDVSDTEVPPATTGDHIVRCAGIGRPWPAEDRWNQDDPQRSGGAAGRRRRRRWAA